MAKFSYSFDIVCNPSGFTLTFHDFKEGILHADTRDELTIKAQDFLDTKIYDLLKNKSQIPMPSRRASHDKSMSPSEALVMALEFYTSS